MPVHTEISGPVTTIVMQRPEVRNAVDAATADALVAAFEAFDRDPQAKVAVFFGAHGAFCAGWDLNTAPPWRARTRAANSIWIFRRTTLRLRAAPWGPRVSRWISR